MAGAKMGSMRLLFVTSFYPPVTGGGSSRIHDFSRLLASIGFEVTVLTFSPFHSLLGMATSKEVKVIRLPTLGFKHPLDQIFLSFVGTMLINIARAQDFVIVSLPMGEPCIGAFLACNLLGKRLVVDIRDEWEDMVIKRTRRFFTRNLYRFYKKLFTAIYRNSSFVTTVTPTLVERIRRRGVSNVYLMPNGADTELFHPISEGERSKMRKKMGLQEDDFVIVFAGRVGWYYRIDIVIKALHKLINRQRLGRIKFLVMGPGEKVQEYLDLCKRLELKKNILFLGEKRREEVAEILPCCDLGVIPLDDDPIWLSVYTAKVFEYCASELPVVISVTKGSDLEKLVKENNIGFIAEPLKSERLAEAIFAGYRDKDRLKEMRVEARKLVVEGFSKRKIAEELTKILKTYKYA